MSHNEMELSEMECSDIEGCDPIQCLEITSSKMQTDIIQPACLHKELHVNRLHRLTIQGGKVKLEYVVVV